MKIIDTTWTIAEARDVISKCQTAALSYDYNLCLGGSVLNNGFSNNDLDIVAIPRSSKRKPLKEDLIYSLRIFFSCEPFSLEDSRYECEGREIWRFSMGNKIVDLIIIVYES